MNRKGLAEEVALTLRYRMRRGLEGPIPHSKKAWVEVVKQGRSWNVEGTEKGAV